jgi:hypothetical protein
MSSCAITAGRGPTHFAQRTSKSGLHRGAVCARQGTRSKTPRFTRDVGVIQGNNKTLICYYLFPTFVIASVNPTDLVLSTVRTQEVILICRWPITSAASTTAYKFGVALLEL